MSEKKPATDPRLDGLFGEIQHYQHAVQSAVAFEMSTGRSHDTNPKQLRVGINSAMVEHGALVKLLVEKGVITDLEYFTATRDMWKRELESYLARNPGFSFS